jgi:two-component system chemotaxis response regulator CheB
VIRVVLADDSPSVRAVLRRLFARTADFRVVAEASDGAAAVQAVLDHQPQVVVMDLLMPVMDGYGAIERIMAWRPTPIVVLSSRANRNQMQTAFEAIRRGAIEVLPKPEDTGSWEVLAASLPAAVRVAADARPRAISRPAAGLSGAGPPRGAGAPGGSAPAARGGGRSAAGAAAVPLPARPARRSPPVPPPGPDAGAGKGAEAMPSGPPVPRRAAARAGTAARAPAEDGGALRWVVVGASTGGPAAIRELLEELPAAPPVSVLIVQHIAAGFEAAFAEWLNKELPLDVRLARDGERPAPGAVRLAPAGAHLLLEAGGVLHLDTTTPARRGHLPSVDELFLSCARCCPAAAAGVLLTGMGSDGVEGLAALHQAGALTLVQDEATSVVFGMPRVALERGVARLAQPPRELAHTLARRWQRCGEP